MVRGIVKRATDVVHPYDPDVHTGDAGHVGWDLAKEMRKQAERTAKPSDVTDPLVTDPSAMVDAIEAIHRAKQRDDFSWTDVIKTQLAAHGYEGSTDGLLTICRRVGQEYADYTIKLERMQLAKERQEQAAALKPLLDVMREFLEMTELGQFDEIVSVAIKGPDGRIRVVGKQ